MEVAWELVLEQRSELAWELELEQRSELAWELVLEQRSELAWDNWSGLAWELVLEQRSEHVSEAVLGTWLQHLFRGALSEHAINGKFQRIQYI